MTAEAGKPLTLQALRGAMEGIVPAVMATASADGVPNVAYLSQVEYVDDRHVALSHQFFNTTRRNVLATRRATLLMVDPATAMMVRLSVRYLRTEENGALFERMKARLAGIASYSGMDGVFRLLGSDTTRWKPSRPSTAASCRPRCRKAARCPRCGSSASACPAAPIWPSSSTKPWPASARRWA